MMGQKSNDDNKYCFFSLVLSLTRYIIRQVPVVDCCLPNS